MNEVIIVYNLASGVIVSSATSSGSTSDLVLAFDRDTQARTLITGAPDDLARHIERYRYDLAAKKVVAA